MTIAVLAEKPSVARDIARVLGAKQRRDGFLEGNGYAVTWALGHLVAVAEPHQIKPQWKRWQASELPMIPAEWPLEVVSGTRDRFEVVCRLLQDPEVDEIVCATDASDVSDSTSRNKIELRPSEIAMGTPISMNPITATNRTTTSMI